MFRPCVLPFGSSITLTLFSTKPFHHKSPRFEENFDRLVAGIRQGKSGPGTTIKYPIDNYDL